MKFYPTFVQSVVIVAATVIAIGFWGKTTEAAAPITVDCNAGETIQDALDDAEPGKNLRILIVGICNESPEIKIDDVTLEDKPGAGGIGTIQGTITIDGARRVKIKDITVVNATGAGIIGKDGASFTVQHAVVEFNGSHGIIVERNSVATIKNGTKLNENVVRG